VSQFAFFASAEKNTQLAKLPNAGCVTCRCCATLAAVRCRACLLLFTLLGCGQTPDIVVGRLDVVRDDAGRSVDAPADAGSGVGRVLDSGVGNTTGALPLILDAASSVGAGTPDASSVMDAARAAGCAPAPLLHDYVFNGVGALVSDANGGEDAVLVGGAQLGSATDPGVQLDGDDDYIRLPQGLLSGLSSTTLSIWFKVDGGPGYVRILDFGAGSTDPAVEGDGSVGRSYIALTPATGLERTGLAALASSSGSGDEVAIDTELEVRDDVLHQVNIVVDSAQSSLRLYLDGAPAGEAALPFELAEIEDVNNWLGRSQYDADPYFKGRFYRLAMYSAALTDCQVLASWQGGTSAN
jgi:hypothetical protein